MHGVWFYTSVGAPAHCLRCPTVGQRLYEPSTRGSRSVVRMRIRTGPEEQQGTHSHSRAPPRLRQETAAARRPPVRVRHGQRSYSWASTIGTACARAPPLPR